MRSVCGSIGKSGSVLALDAGVRLWHSVGWVTGGDCSNVSKQFYCMEQAHQVCFLFWATAVVAGRRGRWRKMAV